MGVFSRRLSRVSLLSAIALLAAGAALYVLLFSPATSHHKRSNEEAADAPVPDEEEWRPTQKEQADGRAVKAAAEDIAAVTLFGVLKDVPDLKGESRDKERQTYGDVGLRREERGVNSERDQKRENGTAGTHIYTRKRS